MICSRKTGLCWRTLSSKFLTCRLMKCSAELCCCKADDVKTMMSEFCHFFFSHALSWFTPLPCGTHTGIFPSLSYTYFNPSVPRCFYLQNADSPLWPGDFLTSVIYHCLHPSVVRKPSFSWILRKTEENRGKACFSSLSLKEGHKTWNARERSHRNKAICICLLPLLPFSFVSHFFSSW